MSPTEATDCACCNSRVPPSTPGIFGFSPEPKPELIATYKTKGPAIALSKGLDRDRAVDESGNQIAVFGRRGARPFNLEEMKRLYLRNGKLYTVSEQAQDLRRERRDEAADLLCLPVCVPRKWRRSRRCAT